MPEPNPFTGEAEEGVPSPSSALSHRVAAIALFLFALVFFYGAEHIEYSFSSDPLGPETFPIMIAGVIAAFSVWYFVFPHGEVDWPDWRLALRSVTFMAVCFLSAALYEPAGFIVATIVLCTLTARIFHAGWIASLMVGVGNAVVFWFLFQQLLAIPLPAGPLF